jgi:hypothetical protein
LSARDCCRELHISFYAHTVDTGKKLQHPITVYFFAQLNFNPNSSFLAEVNDMLYLTRNEAVHFFLFSLTIINWAKRGPTINQLINQFGFKKTTLFLIVQYTMPAKIIEIFSLLYYNA